MNALAFAEKKQLVEAAVARLETVSSAEAVCVVATESGRYDRAESLLAICFALIGVVASDAVFHALHDGWTATPLWVSGLGVAVGFGLGLFTGSTVHPLRRLLVSRAEQEEEVQRAAAAAFTNARVGSVNGRGVLIYVSLFEHRVVVLADGDAFARALVDKAVAGFKAGGTTDVLATLIDEIGVQLASKFPPEATRGNRLPDHLVVLHPR